MEISFFSAPEANTNMSAQSNAVCPSQEFSLLMAAFLKSAQPEVFAEAGVSETDPQPTRGLKMAQPQTGMDVDVEGSSVLEPDEISVKDTPALVIDAVASLFVPNRLERAPREGAEITAAKATPSPASDMLSFGVAAAYDHVPVSDGEQQTPSVENAVGPMKEAKIEPSSGFEVPDELQEHFEIEIPAEEIIGRKDEPEEAGMPLVAQARKPSEDLDGARLEAPVYLEPSAGTEADDAVSAEQPLNEEPLAVETPSSFMREFDLGGNREENITQSNPPDAEVQKTPENLLPGLSFERTLDQLPPKTEAGAVRPTIASEVHEKVQAGIKVSVENNGGEVKMKLHPESLGEVRIKINVDAGMVRAEIIVDNPEVKSIIESDSSFLRDSLGAHGLTLEKCVVEVGRSFEAGQHEADERRSSYGDEHRPARDEKEHEKGKGAWHRHFRHNQAAHDGGIDFFA